jgi:hypothetical protein
MLVPSPRAPLAPHRAELDVDLVGAQVVDRSLDWSRPFEAEIATARVYRKPSNRGRLEAGPMYVELLLAEAVHRNTVRLADELRAEDLAIERIRAPALADMDHAVIDANLHHTTLLRGPACPSQPAAAAVAYGLPGSTPTRYRRAAPLGAHATAGPLRPRLRSSRRSDSAATVGRQVNQRG